MATCTCNNGVTCHTLLLGPCLATLEVEMAYHVVDNAFAPLKGDDDRIVLVSPLELI